jgi:hypothetical protein
MENRCMADAWPSHRGLKGWRRAALHLALWLAVVGLLLLWLWPDRAV